MFLLRYFNLRNAWRDLKRFQARRQPHELYFFVLAMVLTLLVIAGFAKDSYAVKVYHPNIIYAKSWPANRTEAQVLADQKADAAAKAKQDAIVQQAEDERRAQFQRLNNELDAWGL